jgi:hypothetical protein
MKLTKLHPEERHRKIKRGSFILERLKHSTIRVKMTSITKVANWNVLWLVSSIISLF